MTGHESWIRQRRRRWRVACTCGFASPWAEADRRGPTAPPLARDDPRNPYSVKDPHDWSHHVHVMSGSIHTLGRVVRSCWCGARRVEADGLEYPWSDPRLELAPQHYTSHWPLPPRTALDLEGAPWDHLDQRMRWTAALRALGMAPRPGEPVEERRARVVADLAATGRHATALQALRAGRAEAVSTRIGRR